MFSVAGDVPQITDWQDDSDLECGHEEDSVSEAAESEVAISDSESVSSNVLTSKKQSDVEALKVSSAFLLFVEILELLLVS